MNIEKTGVINLNILVTGGAGFIGRWVVKKLLTEGHRVWVLDDLSNGSKKNLKELMEHKNLVKFVIGDIRNLETLEALFKDSFDICYHLGASINVQDSIDDPRLTFENDAVGTYNVLEQCKKHGVKIVFMSTCMVYDRAVGENGITEQHPVKPASPYAGSKIAGENMVLSFWNAYKLPVVVIRPFNTYGPFQKSSGEGGVVSIFIQKALKGEDLNIYGSGEQTRDLLYVEDCADFVVSTGLSDAVDGEIVNAGTGMDITVNDLARLICGNESRIRHIPHIHPQSEIMKLLCNYDKAKSIIGWKPKHSLEEGIELTRRWIRDNMEE